MANRERSSIEDLRIKSEGSILHYTPSTYPAGIKKIASETDFESRKNSFSSYMKNGMPSTRRRSDSVTLEKNVKFRSDSTEVILNNMTKSDGIDEDEIKRFPVSMNEKRIHRDSMYIPPVSWHQRIIDNVMEIYQKIQCPKWMKFTLWDRQLKVIEGRFGVGVVSYFLFIRWLLKMNIIVLALNLIFIVLPHLFFISSEYSTHYDPTVDDLTLNLTDKKIIKLKNYESSPQLNKSALHNEIPRNLSKDGRFVNKSDISAYCYWKYTYEIRKAHYSNFVANIQSFLQGTGILEPTLLFLGHYPNRSITYFGFKLSIPMSFMMVFMMSMIICFIMMVNYSSFGMRDSFLTQHSYIHFMNDVICAWDYSIRNYDAAKLHHQSFVVQLKSNLSETHRQKKLRERSSSAWKKLYLVRFGINLVVIIWIASCYWLIIITVKFQLSEQQIKGLEAAGFRTLLIQFLPPTIVVLIASISPLVFSFLVTYEEYHGNNEVNISVLRNVFLSLSSILVLVITLLQKIMCKPKDICGAGMSLKCNTPRCWETYVGQQLYKLSLSQLFIIIAIFVLYDIPRDYIVQKYYNKYTRFFGRACFHLPTEVLLPIYSQTILWLGVLYSPVIPCITIVLLILLFYIKKAKVMKYSEPAQVLYKASRFNAVFTNILIVAFLAVLFIHVYTLINVRPSLGCGPFRTFDSMIDALEITLKSLPFNFFLIWNFFFSGWFFVPAATLLCAIIYYYWNYNAFLTRMERTLKAELVLISNDNQFLLSKIDSTKKSA